MLPGVHPPAVMGAEHGGEALGGKAELLACGLEFVRRHDEQSIGHACPICKP